jgi:hypothetical protein
MAKSPTKPPTSADWNTGSPNCLAPKYGAKPASALHIGPEAERRFGHRHFMGMTAVFTGAPEFTVLVGREELGRIDPALLTEEVQGDRRLLLNGRSWRDLHRLAPAALLR